jgi:hypothetical protein
MCGVNTLPAVRLSEEEKSLTTEDAERTEGFR